MANRLGVTAACTIAFSTTFAWSAFSRPLAATPEPPHNPPDCIPCNCKMIHARVQREGDENGNTTASVSANFKVEGGQMQATTSASGLNCGNFGKPNPNPAWTIYVVNCPDTSFEMCVAPFNPPESVQLIHGLSSVPVCTRATPGKNKTNFLEAEAPDPPPLTTDQGFRRSRCIKG